MLYVKKNAKNQMLIYNKSKQVSGGTNLQNQASTSMLSANPSGTSSTAPGNAAAVSNNFVKSSQGQQTSAVGQGGSSLAQNASGSQQMQRSADVVAPKTGGGRKRQGSNHKLPPGQAGNYATAGATSAQGTQQPGNQQASSS